MGRLGLMPAIALTLLAAGVTAVEIRPHAVPREHPRLLGSRQELQELARARPEAYKRMADVARRQQADDHAKIISMALVSAIENDAALDREVVKRALKIVDGPIRTGHVTFGHDLALAAIAYDLCWDSWTAEERARFHQYVNKTAGGNVGSETHVFHNGWYGYKHWGLGLAGYAGYHENPRAPEILKTLYEDYRTRAAPALELAGEGGGWAEGYYIHYWLYEWLFFCEVARHCEGLDLYTQAPRFYRQRAVADMFEMYPGVREYGSRRPIPTGDSGGIAFGGDRDKALAARRILCSRFRDDPDHQAVQAFNETTPRSSVGVYAYKDFLWRDPAVPKGNLKSFKLSHLAPGPGYVYARSSWDEDATYFFFKCGDRFTAHQHLDVGHFLIYRHEELAGDGGFYEDFSSAHAVNYYLRTIAHNTLLVLDPAEKWPAIRAGPVSGNDGGQHHAWPHHNGAVADPAAWQKDRRLYDLAEILAFEDRGAYLYVAGDCTRAYAPKKLDAFTRQIVFLRPGTFVIFDRVAARDPAFKKTWLLQAAKPPTGQAPKLVVTNGKGRLFIQTLLPENAQVKLCAGADLYSYGGRAYPPEKKPNGPVPECRIEISPAAPAAVDYFLHVLTAADSTTDAAPEAVLRRDGDAFTVTVGRSAVTFTIGAVGGRIELDGRRLDFAKGIVGERGAEPKPAP